MSKQIRQKSSPIYYLLLSQILFKCVFIIIYMHHLHCIAIFILKEIKNVIQQGN